MLLSASGPELVWSHISAAKSWCKVSRPRNSQIVMADGLRHDHIPCNGKGTRSRNIWGFDHFRDPSFRFFIYAIMILCGITILPMDCEFQNRLVSCSWSHSMTPASNQLPRTGPWFSFSVAVTMEMVTHHLLFLLSALFFSRTALFTQMLNSSLPCTLTWWNLSTSQRSPNMMPPSQSSVVKSGPHLPSEPLLIVSKQELLP